MQGLNAYPYGTVWTTPDEDKMMLVVSDTGINTKSGIVTVLIVERGGEMSAESIVLDVEENYRIRCDLITTLNKSPNELVSCVGGLSEEMLVAARAKLKERLKMLDEAITPIKAVADIFKMVTAGGSHQQGEIAHNVASAWIPPSQLATPSALNESDSTQNNNGSTLQKPADNTKEEKKSRISKITGLEVRTVRNYSGEDLKFLVDMSNTTKDVMRRFNFTEAKQAHGARTHARKSLGIRGPARKYTDEDRAFLLDKNNTNEDIMKRFGFKSSKQVRSAKSYARRIIREASESGKS